VSQLATGEGERGIRGALRVAGAALLSGALIPISLTAATVVFWNRWIRQQLIDNPSPGDWLNNNPLDVDAHDFLGAVPFLVAALTLSIALIVYAIRQWRPRRKKFTADESASLTLPSAGDYIPPSPS
jgi:hypothetical protein